MKSFLPCFSGCLTVLVGNVAFLNAQDLARPSSSLAPISASNADRLQVLDELEKSVFRIRRGPDRTQFTFLDFNKGIEIVSESDWHVEKKISVKQPVHVDVTMGHPLIAWRELRASEFTIQNLKSGRTTRIKTESNTPRPTFSPQQLRIAVGETRTSDPKIEGSGYSFVNLFDVDGNLERRLEITEEGYGALTPVFSHDGKLLAVGNRNYETKLYEVATGQLLKTFERDMTHELAFSPDDRTLAATYVDGAVALWDVRSGKKLHERKPGAVELYSLDWSPRGDLLVTSGNQGKIVLWNPDDMSRVTDLEGPSWIIQVRFNAEGTRLLSSGGNDFGRSDRKVTVWGNPAKQ